MDNLFGVCVAGEVVNSFQLCFVDNPFGLWVAEMLVNSLQQ